jgi:putative sterol carrier protein
MAASAREFFEAIPNTIDPEKTKGETVSYRFDIDGAGSWKVDVVDGAVTVAESTGAADCAIWMKEETLLRLIDGKQNPATAFMTGKIKVEGRMELALKLQQLFF